MKGSDTNITDLVAVSTVGRQTVEQRIERRLEVLREWLRDGVPAGAMIPKSLTAAREWVDEKLGIFAISSPNEFTTTHIQHGRLVHDVASLLTALRKRYGRPRDAPRPRSADATTKFDRAAHDRQLQAVVSQWHSERDQRLRDKETADSAQALSIVLLGESAQKDSLIADLRRQITARTGLREVQ